LASISSSVSTSKSGASSGTIKRVAKELESLLKDPHPNAEIFTDQNDLLHWIVLLKVCFDREWVSNFAYFLQGTIGTDYEGGVWVLEVNFPNDFPFKPPSIRFSTQIYHPNISKEVRIHLSTEHTAMKLIFIYREESV
jgi:ubiquitin-protein ligase